MSNETVSASAQVWLEQQYPEQAQGAAASSEQQNSVPYPGMREAFEIHYGQSFVDRDWRRESSVWAAAWKAAKAHDTKEQQTQEPVVWRYQDSRGHYRYRSYVKGFDADYKILRPVPLYAAPPLRDLSDEEIMDCWKCQKPVQFARAILAKAREKV